MQRYDEDTNGHEVEAKLNEEFEISLLETRTAGYRWTVESAGAPVCRMLEEANQTNSAGVGGSGKHVWRFEAVAAGTGEIKLRYDRPWENSAETARTFVLKVRAVA
jgi:inhibitor of cysteine peptidase